MLTGTTGTTLSNRRWFKGRKVKCSYDAGEAMDFISSADKDIRHIADIDNAMSVTKQQENSGYLFGDDNEMKYVFAK